MPRNISPSTIVGLPDAIIENVTLKNIEIHYPGGGNPSFASVGLNELDKVPEMAASYPEFSMFKELPAWGFYIRHSKGITFENVELICGKKDYRAAIVLDDVTGGNFKSIRLSEPGGAKGSVYLYKSTAVVRYKK